MHLVSGEGIRIERNSADPANDALRITNTFTENAVNEFTLTPTGSFANVTGLTFDIDAISDVIFLDYSLNIAGAVAGDNNYTAGGQMSVVGNKLVGSGTATLADSQVEVRDEVGDPFAGNTVICANFNGVDAATAFTESARSEPAVFIGNAQLDTAQFNFATSSLLLDGTQDAITFGTDAADWAAYGPTNTDDFTVEAFVRFAVLPTVGNQMTIAAYRFTDATQWEFEVHNNAGTYQLRGRRGAAVLLTGTITPVINTWYHAALQVRGSGTNIDLLWAGNRVATGNSGGTGLTSVSGTKEFPITVGGYDDTIGGIPSTITKSFNGHIDDFRYTVGTARYGSGATYTVPASPLCAPPAPMSGDVNFQATYVPGSPNLIQIQYTNTFADSATMRVVRKRWMSF